MSDPLIEEIIKELEQSYEKLSHLHKGSLAKYDGSLKYDGSASYSSIESQLLSPIIENLNTVIRDLKKSIGRDS